MSLAASLWRAPGLGSAIRALERWGGWILPRPEVPPVPPATGPGPLDVFARESRRELWAGAACVDMTPEDVKSCWLAGFGPGRRCTGLRDPLYARCLVLQAGSVPLVLIGLDLIGLFANRVQRLRALIGREHPASVWIACTHNHQGPDSLGLWGPAVAGSLPWRSGLDPAYMDLLERRVLAAVEAALAASRPARLYAAQGCFDKAGRWVHNERSPVLDRRMRVLQVDDLRGESIATLVQQACHPETLWSDNTRMSADFCAACCRSVERRLGGTALYFNGALGAMVSAAVGHHTPPAVRESLPDELGREMGRVAARLARRARGGKEEEPILQVALAQVRLPAEDNRLFAFLHAMGIIEGRDLAGGLRSELSLARLGSVWLLGLPGEPAPELGLELLSRLPGSRHLLLGLANDELGYLLPPDFFHDPTYAYEQSMSPGPMAATRLALALERLLDSWEPASRP